MKTIEEWLEELPEEYRDRALELMNPLVVDNPVETMANALLNAFRWSSDDFRKWSALHSEYSAKEAGTSTPAPSLTEQLIAFGEVVARKMENGEDFSVEELANEFTDCKNQEE